ncbi:MAG: DUF3307 domain-containing protein [Gemmatimonadota bacterium]
MPPLSEQAVWLLLALLFAHWLGDFTPLATARMQKAKVAGGPVGPILAHAGVHALLVCVVIFLLRPPRWLEAFALAGALEFATHFGLDAVRAKLTAGVPALADPTHKAFWSLLGFDQFLHAAVLVAIAWIVL